MTQVGHIFIPVRQHPLTGRQHESCPGHKVESCCCLFNCGRRNLPKLDTADPAAFKCGPACDAACKAGEGIQCMSETKDERSSRGKIFQEIRDLDEGISKEEVDLLEKRR